MSDTPRAVQLRASLVWRDEVMGDVVLTKPRAITVGTGPRSTFVIPDLGLPDRYAIVKPGNRGYLLTLGESMRGTLNIDGSPRDVEEFVRRGGEGEAATSFRATPIGGRDWGLIDLDPSGDYKLFFQFVPVEAPLPRPQFGRYREVAAAALLMLGGAIAFPSYATIIVLGAMGLTAIAEIVMSFLRAEDDDLTRPAIAFSIILFALLLGVTFKFRSPDHPWVYPGPRELTGSYLVNRLQEPPPPPPPEPEKKVGAGAKAEAASDQGEKKNSKAASKGEQGKAGGKGDVRAADPDVKEEGPPPPEVGFMTGRNRKELDRINELDHLPNLAAFGQGRKGPKTKGDAGMGKGSGIGVGDDEGGFGTHKGSKGKGRGGGGSAEGDFVSQGDVDTGETRAPKGTGGKGSGVKESAVVAIGTSTGDFSGLSREEIDRVVKSRKGTIQACYQKEVNRTRGIAGKLVVSFTINAAGKVTSARVDGGKSSLRNAGVESCVKRQILGLKFPAKGGAVVNYPFIFSQG
ncbi:MAG: AgmX/PglI C-terminal domain-containing protein [Kofleriaceae bacterium]|nr:AgmX/PglI C-terminal domain-containing protein [Myxococcales bacterium]MCB9573221.1 AgmX/PglI C-terminal domain-containing protein [Kofleriaceae bacterium]